MDESYDTAKKALVGLMGKYNDSKNVHNIFQRYNMLKAMIKVSNEDDSLNVSKRISIKLKEMGQDQVYRNS